MDDVIDLRMKIVSRNVRWLTARLDDPYTVTQLARELGLSAQSLSYRLNGHVRWTLEDLAKLEELTGIPVEDWLLPFHGGGPQTRGATGGYHDPAHGDAA